MEISDIVVKDEENRLVEGFATVEIVDRQKDIIPIEAFSKAMIEYMARGGIVLYGHENKPIGKVVQWNIEKVDNVDGIKILVSIYKDTILADEVWGLIKNKSLLGFSIGGVAKEIEERVAKNGIDKVRILKSIELNEISIVSVPANSEAVITGVSLAKSMDKYIMMRPSGRWWKKCIEKAVGLAENPAKLCGFIFYDLFGGDRKEAVDVDEEIIKTGMEIMKNFEEIKKPFASFKNWDDCMKKMKKRYTEEVAQKVCGKLKAEYENKEDIEMKKSIEELADEVIAKIVKEKYPWDQCIKDQMAEYGSKEIARKVCGAIRSRYGKSINNNENIETFNSDSDIVDNMEESDMNKEDEKIVVEEEKPKEEDKKTENTEKDEVSSDTKIDLLISSITRLIQLLQTKFSNDDAEVVVDETEKANYKIEGEPREDVEGVKNAEPKDLQDRVVKAVKEEVSKYRKTIKKSANIEGGIGEVSENVLNDNAIKNDVAEILEGKSKAIYVAKKYRGGA